MLHIRYVGCLISLRAQILLQFRIFKLKQKSEEEKKNLPDFQYTFTRFPRHFQPVSETRQNELLHSDLLGEMPRSVRINSELRSENILIIYVDPREQTPFRKMASQFVIGSRGRFKRVFVRSSSLSVWAFAVTIGIASGVVGAVAVSVWSVKATCRLLHPLCGLSHAL